MPSKADLAKLSDEVLEKEINAVANERTKLGEKQDELAAERDRRFQEAQAARVLDGMSAGERDVLIEAAKARVKSEGKAPGGDA